MFRKPPGVGGVKLASCCKPDRPFLEPDPWTKKRQHHPDACAALYGWMSGERRTSRVVRVLSNFLHSRHRPPVQMRLMSLKSKSHTIRPRVRKACLPTALNTIRSMGLIQPSHQHPLHCPWPTSGHTHTHQSKLDGTFRACGVGGRVTASRREVAAIDEPASAITTFEIEHHGANATVRLWPQVTPGPVFPKSGSGGHT